MQARGRVWAKKKTMSYTGRLTQKWTRRQGDKETFRFSLLCVGKLLKRKLYYIYYYIIYII